MFTVVLTCYECER